MANYYEVPVTPVPQRMAITLAGKPWNLGLYWNDISGKWIFDLSDQDKNPVLSGIPVVAGVDLLGQFEYLGIGGSLVVQTDADPYQDPTYENFGTGSRLIFVTE